jgi:hypothetical protein
LVRLLLLFTVWDLKWRDLLPDEEGEEGDGAPGNERTDSGALESDDLEQPECC